MSGSAIRVTLARYRMIGIVLSVVLALLATQMAGASDNGSSDVMDGPSLVGSGPDREIVASDDDVAIDGPTLVGSGPEREIVAARFETPVLVGSGAERELVASHGPTLVGSGPEREDVAGGSDHVALEGPSLVGSGPDREIVASAGASPQTVGGVANEEP